MSAVFAPRTWRSISGRCNVWVWRWQGFAGALYLYDCLRAQAARRYERRHGRRARKADCRRADSRRPGVVPRYLNNTALKSSLLASVITERPARIRLLGKSQMMPLNATAFVVVTGNGISISEDLARRFITVEFDPRTEDPEARPFTTDILVE